MNNDRKEEIVEALNFTINSGYFDEQESEKIAIEYLEEFYMDNDFPAPSYNRMKKIINEVGEMRPLDTGQKNYERLQGVFDQLNREGIISIDYAGFDISEGHEEVGVVFKFMKENDLLRNGYCFYHQQDIERCMDSENRTLFLAFHSLNGDEEMALKVGKRIVDLLNQARFEVEWTGSLNQRIGIKNFYWDKLFNLEPVGSTRALKIMQQSNEAQGKQ